MKKYIWYIVWLLIIISGSFALNLNMDISNLIAYFKKVVFTTDGTSNWTETISIDGEQWQIKWWELNIDLSNWTLDNGNNKLDLKNGTLNGSKINIDLKNWDIHVGWNDFDHKVVIQRDLSDVKNNLQNQIDTNKNEIDSNKGDINNIKNDINQIKTDYATKAYVDSKSNNQFDKIYLNDTCYVSDSDTVWCNADKEWCIDIKNYKKCIYEDKVEYNLDWWAIKNYRPYLKWIWKDNNYLYNIYLKSHSEYKNCILKYTRIWKPSRRPWIWSWQKRCTWVDGEGTVCDYGERVKAGRNWSKCNITEHNCKDRKRVWNRHIHFIVDCYRFVWK